MKDIGLLTGQYTGSGTWHDWVGKSQAYRVVQTNRDDGDHFDIAFRHDFDDGSVTEANFRMTWITPQLFEVAIGGKCVGKGYLLAGCCHYYLQVGAAFVEASYRVTDSGLVVHGSSTTNAEGHFIAWHEELVRT
jgi:hypothetical protein